MRHNNKLTGWQQFSLIELANYHNGFAFKPADWSEDGSPIIRIEQITNPLSKVDYFQGSVPEVNRIKSGDLIFSWSATLKVVIWKGGDAILNQHLFKVVPKPGFDLQFLYQLLDFHMERLSNGSHGSTMKHIKRGELISFMVEVPSFIQQKNIASILSNIDEVIAASEALMNKYQLVKSGLMHDLFTRGILPNGKLRPPREQAPELYKESELGWIPREWTIGKLLDLAEKKKGSTTIGPFGSDLIAADYQDEGVPVVFVRDIKNDGFVWHSSVYVSPKKAQQLKSHSVCSGDILVTKMGLPPCISCWYPEWMPNGIITADVIRVSPDCDLVNNKWLSLAINSDTTIRQVASITAGVTRPKVTLADFRAIKIAKPDLAEQNSIMEFYHKIENTIQSQIALLEKLKLQKLGLMHDLLTGKVEVLADESVDDPVVVTAYV